MPEQINKYKSKSEEALAETKFLNRFEDDVQTNNREQENDKSPTDDDAKEQDIKALLAKMPLTKSTKCGFWIFKGNFFQRFANATSYVLISGIAACIFNTTFPYFNGTMSTMEKRFKIPSRNSGIICVGFDTSTLSIAVALCYVASKGHRPRWIGFAISTIITSCLLMASPHFIYGPGDSALYLTAEFGIKPEANTTKQLNGKEESKALCRLKPNIGCAEEEGHLTPQIVFFLANFIAGIGGSLFDSLGATYMDDNIEKSKAPLMLSICFFLRMLGPAMGYVMASFCLRLFIAPQLEPTITVDDPRWLGAWWLGWLIIGGLLSIFGVLVSMFPKHLPLTIARRVLERECTYKQKLKLEPIKEEQENLELLRVIKQKMSAVETLDSGASIKDMAMTFKELVKNKTFMYSNGSSAFYCFGYIPFWIFTAKYIEIQYHQSASTSSLVTGVAGFAFSAIGVLSSGFVISRFKPSARSMAAWNVLCTVLTFLGVISYAFVGCDVNHGTTEINLTQSNLTTCNSACDCDYVQYSPVCGENGVTYLSPCHAGCKRQLEDKDGKQVYYDCACVLKASNDSKISNLDHAIKQSFLEQEISYNESQGGQASNGACQVDCVFQFVIFIVIMSLLKFLGATSQASTFLLQVRCVPEKYKTTSLGFRTMLMSTLVFIPGPIFYGWIFDCVCLVWGKTCTSEGNCWQYNSQMLRYVLNFTSASFIAIGTIFDICVWFRVHDLNIFDEEAEEIKMENIQNEVKFISHNKRSSF